jgi:hypothetical protein
MDTIQQHGPQPRRHEQIAGRRVRYRKPAQTLPTQPFAPAFLRHRFLPLVADHPILSRNRRVQGEFFRSVGNLAQLYRLAVLEMTGLPYPLNIHATFVHLKQQLEKAHPALSLVIVQTKDGTITLATAKAVDLQSTLFYIPLLPIFNLLRRPKALQISPILLSLAAFIRQKMGVPDYRDRGSYMADVYSILEQWVDDTDADRENKETELCYREFRRAEVVGDYMRRKLRQPVRITKLFSYLQAFEPVGTWQNRLLALGVDFLKLDLAFPDRSLFGEIPAGFLEGEEEERVGKDYYLSFVYDNYSWLGEEMNDYIETSLQECPVVDAPLTVQYFDQPQSKECHDSTYEMECLRLLNEFAYLLNNITYAEY